MKNNASLLYALLLVIGDFLALVSAFVLAYILRVKIDPRPLIEQIPAMTYLYASLAVLPLWIIVHAFIGLYSPTIYEKRFSELGRLIIGSILGILVVIGYDFVSGEELFPARLVPVYGLVLAFLFLLLFRNLLRMIRGILYRYNLGVTNVLLIGDTEATKELASALANSRLSGYRVVGVVGARAHTGSISHHFPNFEEAVKGIGLQRIHSIIQTELYSHASKNNEILEFAQQHHIAYRFVPGNAEMFFGNIEVELFRGSVPVVAVHQTALVGWGRIAKRLFDIAASALLILITAPIILLISILQLISGGQIFFRQTRLTRFNEEFQVVKFRTFRPAYNGLTPEEAFKKMGKPDLALKYRENGDYIPNDPRFGRFGNFLRRTSLDELPQLFNVLKGDLSLVGPRALVPEELGIYAKKHTILSVKSGLTGLAQVSGRRSIGFEERRKLDMYYVQNWSFWLDIVILLKTVRVILTGDGAK